MEKSKVKINENYYKIVGALRNSVGMTVEQFNKNYIQVAVFRQRNKITTPLRKNDILDLRDQKDIVDSIEFENECICGKDLTYNSVIFGSKENEELKYIVLGLDCCRNIGVLLLTKGAKKCLKCSEIISGKVKKGYCEKCKK